MPEGDTIAYAANRMRPVLEGRVPEEIVTAQRRHAAHRWPERLAGRAVTAIDTLGKHLFVRFDDDLALYSHLRMTGSWRVYQRGQPWRRSPRRAWLILRTSTHEVVEFDGPVLELMTAARSRSDKRIAGLGPDVLAPGAFDEARFLRRLREADPTRGIGDAILDQRIVAGIGNMWKAEACWTAEIDPWRRVADLADAEALAVVGAAREGMRVAARSGVHDRAGRIHDRPGRPCPRCDGRIASRGQGDDNRTTYWCPRCQR